MGRVESAARKVWAKESSVIVSEGKLDVLRDINYRFSLLARICKQCVVIN